MPSPRHFFSHPRRGGFALIAAIGALAALFVLVVAVDSALLMNQSRAGRGLKASNELAELEAAVRLAARQWNGGPAPQTLAVTLDGRRFSVEFDLLPAQDEVYRSGGVSHRPGDAWARVEDSDAGRAAAWLVNATVASERLILLERTADVDQGGH